MRTISVIFLCILTSFGMLIHAQQQNRSYEFEKDYPVFLDKIKSELTYPMAWGNSAITDFEEWRQKGREIVFDAMLTPPPPSTEYQLEVLATQQRSGYEARKIRFNLTEYSRVPAYLLVPDGEGPFPAIVLLHDHGAHFSIGKEKVIKPFDVDSLTIADSEQWIEKCYVGQYPGDYLASQGYVVLAIDALFWGERGRKEGVNYDSQQAISCVFDMLGRSWSGFVGYEDIYSADFLASLPEVDANKIGSMGFSMGGYRSWMLSALSDRVKAGAAICWMTTTDYQLSSLYGKGKGDSNYANVLPGLRNYMDYPHIASLACPKPMLFFNGTSDKLFPVLAVEDAYSTMHHVWDSQSVGNQLKTMLWDTPHVCNRNMQSEVLSFFNAYLK